MICYTFHQYIYSNDIEKVAITFKAKYLQNIWNKF